MKLDGSEEKWFYNLETGEVMQGRQIGWTDRMGPYDTRQEAQQALEIAHERTKAADDYDKADDDWDND